MILLETIARRWWALAFISAFLWAAREERSPKEVLRFIAIAFGVSFFAEWSSTHSVFPYGRYAYTGETRGDETFLSNVPLFVPLTFGIVVWAGRSLATRGRGWWRFVLTGALAAAIIDLVIDPMTLRGSSWFLGDLYRYDARGGWFDVPWSNTGGWILVSAAIIALDSAFDRGTARAPWAEWSRDRPRRGRALAFGICLFFVVLALATRHYSIAGAAAAVSAALFAIARDRSRAAE